ncbi:uncharacterized protein LOC142823083 [Pelodiscus sinensis]|uniref:uncharacterized protein LOC142823083 n=1 Tax=Pelodiscus sinensis TaxID=13735 RepID=UPI003F6B52B1
MGLSSTWSKDLHFPLSTAKLCSFFGRLTSREHRHSRVLRVVVQPAAAEACVGLSPQDQALPEEPKRTRGSWKILSGIRRLCACSQCGSSLAEAEEERRASSPRRWTHFSLKKRKKRKKNSAEKQEEPEEEKPPESPDKNQLDLTGVENELSQKTPNGAEESEEEEEPDRRPIPLAQSSSHMTMVMRLVTEPMGSIPCGASVYVPEPVSLRGERPPPPSGSGTKRKHSYV